MLQLIPSIIYVITSEDCDTRTNQSEALSSLLLLIIGIFLDLHNKGILVS